MSTPVVSASFVMRGAREAVDGGMMHIEQHVSALERAVGENPGLAFDLSRAVVESVCRSILQTKGVAFDPDDDLPRLFKATTNNLPMLPQPASAEADVRRSLEKTVNGLHTAIQGVCELRNACGFASHGAAGPKPPLETVQALLAAEAADVVVGFLSRLHFGSTTPHQKELQYDDNPELNEFIDDACEPVQVLGYEFVPSMVLFQMDKVAYQDVLAQNFVTDAPDIDEMPEGGIGIVSAAAQHPATGVEA